MLEERARANGLTLSEWVRDVLLSAPVDGGPESGEVVLAELLALRSLFLNLQFRAAGSGPGDGGRHARADRAGRRDEDAASAGAAGRPCERPGKEGRTSETNQRRADDG